LASFTEGEARRACQAREPMPAIVSSNQCPLSETSPKGARHNGDDGAVGTELVLDRPALPRHSAEELFVEFGSLAMVLRLQACSAAADRSAPSPVVRTISAPALVAF